MLHSFPESGSLDRCERINGYGQTLRILKLCKDRCITKKGAENAGQEDTFSCILYTYRCLDVTNKERTLY